MDLVTGALLLTGAFNILLGGIILFRAPRTPANLAYALLVICLLAWIGAILALRLVAAPHLQFIALAWTYTAGLGIALSFWYFAALFTGRRVTRVVQAAVLAGALFVGWRIWTSPAFIENISRSSSGVLSLEIGWEGWTFLAYFAVLMLDAFRSLALHYRASDGYKRAQLLSILLGTLLTTLLGATFNVVLVQAGNAAYIGWGPVSTVLMVAFIAFAIVRHHLMSIHLVTTELFTFGLILMLLVNFLVSPNAAARLVEAVTLQLAIVFGTYLIRAARIEAGQHTHRHDDASERRTRPRRSRSRREA